MNEELGANSSGTCNWWKSWSFQNDNEDHNNHLCGMDFWNDQDLNSITNSLDFLNESQTWSDFLAQIWALVEIDFL
jgi:hypothetical protein